MAKHSVVVYGASGYTGMLTMDWLIDQNIPFTAVARNAERTLEMMEQRVVRLESATYEIIECEHDVDQACRRLQGRESRVQHGRPVRPLRSWSAVEAALKAGCHHLDTTGEQGYCLEARERFGQSYAEAGLAAVALRFIHVHDRRNRSRVGA